MKEETKAVVTVSEMARMVGLSRARFYQLQKAGVFPAPVYQGGRPVYTDEMQQVVLEVRKKNRGVNGEPVLFYARRRAIQPAKRKKRADPLPARNKDIPSLLDGLNALGLTTATAAQVLKVTVELFPQGTAGLDQAEVLRAVFLHLKRQNQGGNAGR
jgi:predicted DNA-binding transcriptional regulator AlpA